MIRGIAGALVTVTVYYTVSLYADRIVKLFSLHNQAYDEFRWANVYLVYKLANFFFYAVSFLLLLKRLSKTSDTQSQQSFSYLLKSHSVKTFVNSSINKQSHL